MLKHLHGSLLAGEQKELTCARLALANNAKLEKHPADRLHTGYVDPLSKTLSRLLEYFLSSEGWHPGAAPEWAMNEWTKEQMNDSTLLLCPPEPSGRPAGSGPLPPHRSDQTSGGLPPGHRQHHRPEDPGEGIGQEEAGADGHSQEWVLALTHPPPSTG